MSRQFFRGRRHTGLQINGWPKRGIPCASQRVDSGDLTCGREGWCTGSFATLEIQDGVHAIVFGNTETASADKSLLYHGLAERFRLIVCASANFP